MATLAVPVQCEPFTDGAGNDRPGLAVTVAAHGSTTPLTLFTTSSTTGPTTANPVTTNALGLMPLVYVAPVLDVVDLLVAGVVYRSAPVGVNPLDPAVSPLAHVWDMNARYGLVAGAGTDIAAALTMALSDAAVYAASAGGLVICEFDPGVYQLARALQTTGGAYAQVPLPVNLSTNLPVVMVIRPKGAPGQSSQSYLLKPKAGVVFQSTLTGQSYGANGWPSIFGAADLVIGPPAAGDSRTSWMTLVFEGCRFRQPANPSLAGVNASFIDRLILRGCGWDTTDPLTGNHYVTACTNPTGVFFLPPANNLDGYLLEGFNDGVAHYGGFPVGELMTNGGTLLPLECVTAFFVPDVTGLSTFAHVADVGHAIPTRCAYDLASLSPSTGVSLGTPAPYFGLRIRGLMDSEDQQTGGPSWTQRIRNIHDPRSMMAGEIIGGRVIAALGATAAPFSKLGGKGLTVRPDQAPTFAQPATIVLDTAGRPDSASTPGNADIGGTWTVLTGTWGTQGGRLYTSVATASSAMIIDTGKADCTVGVRSDVVTLTGLAVRFQDANNGLVVDLGSKGDIYTWIAGVATKVLSGTITINATDFVHVVLAGTMISVYVNDALSVTGTVTNFSTQTKHGLWSNNSVAGRVRDFRVTV